MVAARRRLGEQRTLHCTTLPAPPPLSPLLPPAATCCTLLLMPSSTSTRLCVSRRRCLSPPRPLVPMLGVPMLLPVVGLGSDASASGSPPRPPPSSATGWEASGL